MSSMWACRKWGPDDQSCPVRASARWRRLHHDQQAVLVWRLLRHIGGSQHDVRGRLLEARRADRIVFASRLRRAVRRKSLEHPERCGASR